jgi:hypothetical protein
MYIYKIIKLLFWLHIGMCFIYSFDILRVLLSSDNPNDSPDNKLLRREVNQAMDGLQSRTKWYKLAYIAAFIISLIVTFLKFSYIKYFYRKLSPPKQKQKNN